MREVRAERIAGITAVVSGGLFVLALAASTLGGPTLVANGISSTAWHVGPGMMPGGPGMMPGGPGMMGNGSGTTGMGPGMMGFGQSGPVSTPIPGASEVRVQAVNFGFAPNEVHLPKSADVNLTFTNPAGTGVVHDLTVPALGIHITANPGETKTVGLRGLTAGRYDAYCSVPGHADLGMRAIVIVE